MILRNFLTAIMFTIGLSVFTLVHAQDNKMFDIAVTTMDGKSITLNDYVGKKPIYLKFWATWCQDCIKQMPHLQKSYETFGKEVEILAVNIGINDSAESIAATQKEFSLTVPIVVDNSGKLAQSINLVGTPFHILIDIDGNVVFKGNEASAQLDKTLKLLSASNSEILPKVAIEKLTPQPSLVSSTDKLTAIFFTATWCDWYLEESRPAMSQNCVSGQQQVNTLYQGASELNWLGVISHLWTGDKELAEYKNKYQIDYPLVIDSNDQEFVRFNVKDVPTLILLQDGKEKFRTSDFSDEKYLADAILELK
jgi:thiol-disulfide isomerase/thioredoxin